ncbi:MAG: phosphate signaling complex protein PhoU [Xanthomonadaceae bacterium]|nr:phosphate signaling complex protein PhoU [Xanthomonadaceae bacterium]
MRSLVLKMSGYVEASVESAVQALNEKNSSKFELVFEYEKKINECQIEVDQLCLHILGTQNPLAKDLRLILAIIKINTDLERMGDQAKNIAHHGKSYLEHSSQLALTPDLKHMAGIAREMIRDAMIAFTKRNEELAKEVLLKDDSVDELKRKINKSMIEIMKSKPGAVEGAIAQMSISRNIERLADHATNICEDVVFLRTGEDIRHSHQG